MSEFVGFLEFIGLFVLVGFVLDIEEEELGFEGMFLFWGSFGEGLLFVEEGNLIIK